MATTSPRGVANVAAIEADPRWQSVIARDRQADGTFVYSVRTTGVYCRPSCAARRANPENVRFHRTCAEAAALGFRPCRRCRPNEPSLDHHHADRVAQACRTIETAETVPSLHLLAEGAGMSAYHFHRVFKGITGLTPRAYAAAHRARRMRVSLAEAERVADAVYDAGFGAGSRFYAEADAILGMTPARYRKGGLGTSIRFTVDTCSLGAILVAASDRGVCAILMGDDPDQLARDLQGGFPRATLVRADSDFDAIVAKVVAFVDEPRLGLDLPLDVRGTAFQHRVWQALAALPVGTTASYIEIAQAIGAPKAVRAVARACATNVLAVAIPCHRVVRTDGALSGYRWGVERKRALLNREAEQDVYKSKLP